MTPLSWPESLPCLRFEPYMDAPRPGAAQLDIGMHSHRVMVFTNNNEVITCEVVLTSAQEITFREFFETTTVMGTLFFNAPLQVNGEQQTWEVEFYGQPPEYAQPIRNDVVRVSFQLLTREALLNEEEVEITPVDGVLVETTEFWDSIGADPVEWNQAIYDTGGWYDPGPLVDTRISPPNGVGLVRIVSGLDATGSNTSSIDMLKNGGRVVGCSRTVSGSSDSIECPSGLMTTTFGDYFETQTGSGVNVTDRSWMHAEALPPSTRYALAWRNNVDMTLPEGIPTIIPFTTDVVDTDSWHDGGVNPSRFVVPAGVSRIRFTAGAYVNDSGGVRAVQITALKNGVSFAGQFVRSQIRNSDMALAAATAPISVTPGDYFQLRVYVDDDTRDLSGVEATYVCIEEFDSSRPMVFVKKTNSQFFPGTETDVVFETAVSDFYGMHSVSDPTHLVVPAGVTYARLSFNIVTSTTAVEVVARVIKNDGGSEKGLPYDESDSSDGSNPAEMNGFGAWVQVQEGDTFKLALSGAAVTVQAISSVWFCMEVSV